MDDLIIREASDDDAETILTLTRSSFREYEGVIVPPTRALLETVEHVRAALARGGAALALVSGVPVGVVRYEVASAEGFVFMGRLGVLPEYRGRGIGRRLVSWVESKAQALGLGEVRLGVYRIVSKNVQYYESVGYRVYGYHSRPGHHEDVVLLAKRLADNRAR